MLLTVLKHLGCQSGRGKAAAGVCVLAWGVEGGLALLWTLRHNAAPTCLISSARFQDEGVVFFFFCMKVAAAGLPP